MRVIWSPLALDQVVQAFASISAERPSAALHWLEEVMDKAVSLACFPDIGRMVPESERPSLCEVLVAPYRLIYRRDETEVVILTLHHARRDLDLDELAP